MSNVNRRSFLRRTAGTLAGLAAAAVGAPVIAAPAGGITVAELCQLDAQLKAATNFSTIKISRELWEDIAPDLVDIICQRYAEALMEERDREILSLAAP